MESVLAICLSPTFQRMLVFRDFHENEVNRCKRVLEIVSGKGINMSRVLRDLGRPCLNLIQLGGRRTDEFVESSRVEGLRIRFLPVNAGIRTCTTIINEERRTSTELVEEAREVDPDDSGRFLALFREELPYHSAVVLSGTKAMGFSSELYPEIVRECRRLGKLTVLDIKGDDLKACLEERPSVVKPNLAELCATFLPEAKVFENGDDSYLMEDVKKLLESIFMRYGTRSVITRGEKPTLMFDEDGFCEVKGNLHLPVINTIGCGDTLTAAMTHSLLKGEPLCDAVRFGMDCATRKASHIEQGL